MPDAATDTLSQDVRTALGRHILTLADTKRILGIRYSDWLLGAPSIETGIAASSMAQDEWGHARLLYAMLKDLDQDPLPLERDRAADRYTSVDPLDEAFDDWAAFVASAVVVDGALSVALSAFSEGGFELARGRIPKMLAEETFHRDFGAAWFRRLARGSEGAPELLAGHVRSALGRTLAWLAPDDETHRRLVDAGLTASAEVLRGRYDEAVGPVLAAAGIDVSAEAADRDGWDEERRRGPGAPAEEAVERARGDRNRDLFVE